MAGGIDWFRWHHGSVTDPKFGLVAKRAGASVAEVIAMWAVLLESASVSSERGWLAEQDFESIDFALGMEEGKAARIYERMQERGMIDPAGHIVSWHKRQPQREREDDTAAERKRAQRQREKEAAAPPVTPCHATSHQKTPRGEERREEVNPLSVVDDSSPTTSRASPPTALDPVSKVGLFCLRIRDVGIADVNPQHPRLLALIAAGVTVEDIEIAAMDAKGKGKGFAYALGVAEGRRKDAQQAGSRGPPSRANSRDAMREAASFALTGRQPSRRTDERTERDITAESARLA